MYFSLTIYSRMLSRGLTLGRPSWPSSRTLCRRLSTLLTRDPNSITVADLRASSLYTEESDQNTKNQVELIKAINSSSNTQKQQLFTELVPNFSLFFRLNGVICVPVMGLVQEIRGRRGN